LWSTAEPIGVFKNRGRTYLLSRSDEGREVEYGFAQGAIGEFQLSPDMKRFDIPPDRVAVRVSAGGNQSLKILPKDGAPAAVMTMGDSTSKKAEIWEVSGDSWGVIYDGERVSSTEDGIRIRVKGEPFLDLRTFPQGGILSLECDGGVFSPVRGGDWDAFRLRLRLPPMYVRSTSDRAFTVAGAFTGSDLEDLLCRITLEGGGGVLRSGDTAVATIGESDRPFEVSISNHLREGRRSFTVDFSGPTGKIKSVRLVPILVKDIRLHKQAE
jgi:hypothetical protein